jgi:hypothetical protein
MFFVYIIIPTNGEPAVASWNPLFSSGALCAKPFLPNRFPEVARHGLHLFYMRYTVCSMLTFEENF